jgi:putative ABC transport system permease protein
LTLIGGSLPLTGNAIYIPHFIFSGGGYALGDEIKLDFSENSLVFTVAGSTEEMMFGGNTYTVWRFYVSADAYSQLCGRFPDCKYTMLAARMTEGWGELFSAYRSDSENLCGTYDYFRYRTFIPMIPAMIIVVFAFVLLAVGSVVIHFRINNDIEDGVVNLGILKAIGYNSRQIIISVIMQYGLIALAGGIIGIAPPQIALPIITGKLIEPLLGLPWYPAFNAVLTFAVMLLILSMTVLFAWTASMRITKLHPITALRGGAAARGFKANPLPLDKSVGPLNLLLAVKQLLMNKKQTVMLGAIICGLMFSAVAVLAIHYNINVDTDAFVHTVMGDKPDVTIIVNREDDGPVLRKRLADNPDIYCLFGYDNLSMHIDDYMFYITVVEDLSYYTGYSLVRGRFPQSGDEIVLDNISLSEMGKNVGDRVTAAIGGSEQEYVISGVIQIMATFRGIMNIDGLRRVQPDFDYKVFGLQFAGKRDRADTAAFMDAVKNANSDIIADILSLHGHVDNMLGSMGALTAAFTVVIIITTASVVILVLYLIIKTAIVRKKRELGIQKAVGFTTLQLMNQIALNLTPAILIGVTAGAIGGYIGFNPIFTAVMRNMGIAQANLPIPAGRIAVTGLALVVMSYTFSMLIAWNIRKISAYSMVSE